jgi:hypothetical protein
MKKSALILAALLTLISSPGWSQPLKQQGSFEILEKETRDDFFGQTSVLASNTLGRVVIQIDKRILDRYNVDDIANWFRRGDLKFKNNAIRPRMSEVTTGTQSVNGEVVYFISTLVDIDLFGGMPKVYSSFEFNDNGKEFTMAPRPPVSVTPKKVTYLNLKVVEMPTFDLQTGNFDVTVSGVSQAVVRIKRQDGNDVFSTDQEVNTEAVRTVVGKVLLTSVISGTYTITAEAPGFSTERIENVALPPNATIPINLQLKAQTVAVQLFVKDAKGKALTGYALQIRTKTLETVRNELDVPLDGYTVNLPPGDYTITIKLDGFTPILNQELTVAYSTRPMRREFSMRPGSAAQATPSAPTAKPIDLTIEIRDATNKKLSDFTIEVRNDENGDVRNFPPVKGAVFKTKLLPGKYTATIRKANYETAIKSFVLEAGLPKRTEIITIEKNYAKDDYAADPKPSPNIRPKGGWGWLFLVASAGAAGYYLTTQASQSYGTPPALPSL